MFGSIAASATAAAPHVGRAVLVGSKAIAGLAVATRATRFAQARAEELVDQLSLARVAAKVAKQDTDNVTEVRNIS